MKRLAALACALCPFLVHAVLIDEIQVYDDAINAPREFGLEMHVNTTPKGRATPDYPGEVVPNHGTRATAEFSYGLTRALEAGLYVPTSYDAAFRGAAGSWKLRLKWLPEHPEEGGAGWFFGANFELAWLQHRYSQSRNAVEVRTIGGYRDDHWLIAVDPVFGKDVSRGYRGGPADFSLQVKAARDVFGKTQAGLEYYSDMGTTSRILPLREQANTLFAVIDTKVRSMDVNFGVGRGLTGAADKWTVKAIFGIAL